MRASIVLGIRNAFNSTRCDHIMLFLQQLTLMLYFPRVVFNYLTNYIPLSNADTKTYRRVGFWDPCSEMEAATSRSSADGKIR